MVKKGPTRLENAVARMNEAQDALNKAHAECIASEEPLGISASGISASGISADSIDAGHLAIATWNGKTGADAKFGVKHLYSAAYRERWPQDQYPELYKEDVPVD